MMFHFRRDVTSFPIPGFSANVSEPMLVNPQSLSCKIWRLLTLPPKMKKLLWNVSSHELWTSCSLRSNVVDNSLSVPISRGKLLSIGFLIVSFCVKVKNRVKSIPWIQSTYKWGNSFSLELFRRIVFRWNFWLPTKNSSRKISLELILFFVGTQ